MAAVLAGIIVVPVSAGDDNISGAVVPTGGKAIRGTLDGVSNADDVYRVALNGGDSVSLRLTGAPGTDFDLYLYPPSAKDIWRNEEVAWSENPGTSGESIDYDVPSTGTYYVDVASWDSAGSYTLTITSPSRVSIKADKSSLVYGQTATIGGSISPAHTGATATLLQRPATSGSYATAATANVGVSGNYQFTVTPKEATYYQVSWPGDVDHESASSGTVKISVKPIVSILSSASQLPLGNTFTLSGRVSPSHPGQTLSIQRKLSRGWSELKAIKLDSHSRFSWTYQPKSTGTYELRGSFGGDGSHEPAVSGSIKVTVTSSPPS